MIPLKSNRLAFLLLLASVLGMSGFTLMKITGNFGTGEYSMAAKVAGHENLKTARILASFPYLSDGHTDFAVLGNQIIRGDREQIRAYGMDGTVIWTQDTGFTGDILLTTAGSFLLAADVGGTSFLVMDGSSLLMDNKTEAPILTASVSVSGMTCIVHEVQSARNALTVYDRRGRLLFTRLIVERFITFAEVLPSGDRIALSSLDISGSAVINDIEFLDKEGQLTGQRITYDNTAFSCLQPVNTDRILASDNSRAVLITSDGTEAGSMSVKNGEISCIYAGQNRIILAGDTPAGQDLMLFDERGGQKMEASLPLSPTHAVLSGAAIILADSRSVGFFNQKGELQGMYETRTDIRRILSLGDGKIVVITGNSVEVVSL